MFSTDPERVERQLSQWVQGFADKAEQFHAMRAQVEQIQVTESSADGAVRVTVDSNGALTGLVLNDRIRDMAPPQIAGQVMTCLRRAQQQLAPLVQEAIQSTVGDEPHLVDNVVSRYRDRFGEDLHQHSTKPDPDVLGLGEIEDDPGPQPAPRRHYRVTPPDDEEYFADRDYLR